MTSTLPSFLFSTNPSPTLKFSYLAGKLGADPSLPRPFLIGIRGIEVNKDTTHPLVHKPAYDDTAVLLVKGEEPIIFPFATHAYQANSKLAPDTNLDGVQDVGSLRPGRFVMSDPGIMPYPIFILTLPNGSGNLPAYRDFNHDTKLSDDEIQKSINTKTGPQTNDDGCYANSVLWHCGFDAPQDSDHRSSISCQTSNVKWLQLARQKLIQSKTKYLDYVLVNIEDVLKIFDTMPEEFKNPAPINNS
jgi:hypothetical protein